jgi:AcrR family transcriptional regulator
MDSKVGSDYIVVNAYMEEMLSMPTSIGVLMAAPRYHHGDLRAALLTRAAEVVAAGGVDSLSLRELARDLGVSHGAPSRHFADKQALLDALSLDGFERLRITMAAVLPSEDDPRRADFAAQLTHLAAAYVRFAVANASLLVVMFAAKTRQESPAELKTAVDRAFAAPLRAIQRAQETGEVVEGDVDAVATGILATMHGYAALVTAGLFHPDQSGAELAGVIGRLMDGLRPRG